MCIRDRFERLAKIANERLTGDDCMTTKVDVLLNSDGTVAWAYREDVWVVPESVGGDTSGVQIPFTVYNAGNRVKGTFDLTTKTFTADTNACLLYTSCPFPRRQVRRQDAGRGNLRPELYPSRQGP